MKIVRDKKKSETNLKKHHVSFDLAARAFLDDDRVEIYDEKHSVVEERFITIDYVMNVPLFVVFKNVDDQTVGIISARKALRSEIDKNYHQNNNRK